MYAEGGRVALQRVPGVGDALSSAIAEILDTGSLRQLERLEAEESWLEAFGRLPGVGPKLARRIRDELGVSTLEELEVAAHDGRLESVEGFGPKKARSVRDALSVRLGRSRRAPRRPARPEHRPSVSLLLEIDREYREGARLGALRRITPKRFNPAHEAWLPVLETQRGGWDFTALFSNTPRAHDLGRTHDWVVIYHHRDGDAGQSTVVTARAGRLRDLRIVRGREPECRHHYGQELRIA